MKTNEQQYKFSLGRKKNMENFTREFEKVLIKIQIIMAKDINYILKNRY